MWGLAARARIGCATAAKWWLAGAALLSYIGDVGALESIWGKPLGEPEDDASLHDTRESERLSLDESWRIPMAIVARCGRF